MVGLMNIFVDVLGVVIVIVIGVCFLCMSVLVYFEELELLISVMEGLFLVCFCCSDGRLIGCGMIIWFFFGIEVVILEWESSNIFLCDEVCLVCFVFLRVLVFDLELLLLFFVLVVGLL